MGGPVLDGRSIFYVSREARLVTAVLELSPAANI